MWSESVEWTTVIATAWRFGSSCAAQSGRGRQCGRIDGGGLGSEFERTCGKGSSSFVRERCGSGCRHILCGSSHSAKAGDDEGEDVLFHDDGNWRDEARLITRKDRCGASLRRQRYRKKREILEENRINYAFSREMIRQTP